MIDYTLAKELRDANFWKAQEFKDWFDKLDEKAWSILEGTFDPTLSELIEACPKFIRVPKIVGEDIREFSIAYNQEDDTWVARYIFYVNHEGDVYYDQNFGSTPEEAVARLWLALHSK